jgi:acyl-CoA reductase-like NAD-dependent aldehyde dehydrogenase
MAMLEPLRLAVPGLAAGAVVVLKTDPSEPSALVALAELTGRCGFPPGVFNVVHGGEAMLQCFRDLPDVQFMFAQREDR